MPFTKERRPRAKASAGSPGEKVIIPGWRAKYRKFAGERDLIDRIEPWFRAQGEVVEQRRRRYIEKITVAAWAVPNKGSPWKTY
jgi:hypothetical protein